MINIIVNQQLILNCLKNFSDIEIKWEMFWNVFSPVIECTVLFSCVTRGGRGGRRGGGGGGRRGGGGAEGGSDWWELCIHKLHQMKITEDPDHMTHHMTVT